MSDDQSDLRSISSNYSRPESQTDSDIPSEYGLTAAQVPSPNICSSGYESMGDSADFDEGEMQVFDASQSQSSRQSLSNTRGKEWEIDTNHKRGNIGKTNQGLQASQSETYF